MHAPSQLSWVVLLLSCSATSIAATLAVVFTLQAQQARRCERERLEDERERRDQYEDTQQASPASRGETADALSATNVLVDAHSEAIDGGISEEVPAPTPPVPKPVLDLRTLAADDVPAELRVDAYLSPHHMRDFDHSAVFHGCAHVFAVIDAIHPYLDKFFSDSSWVGASSQSKDVTILKTSGKRDRNGRYAGDSDDDADDDDDDDAGGRRSGRSPSTLSRKWRMPDCVDPAESTEIVLYPGVDPRTFAPEKIINLDPNAPKFGAIGSPGRGTSGSGFQRPLSPSARRYSYDRSSAFDEDQERPKPAKKHIVILPGALILGGVFDVSEGSIYIGRHVRIETNTYIKGPCIIGDHSTVRSGAYLRGDLIIGRRVVLRGELKNALVMDHAELCHPGYCGDSICGYKSHFGNQVTTANLNLFYNTAYNEILVDTAQGRYNTGRKKIGVVLGDYSQLGCSTVTDPCTLLQPNTIVYALTRLRKGIYGPNMIVKNKPFENGVLEIAPLVLPPSKEALIADAEEGKRENAGRRRNET